MGGGKFAGYLYTKFKKQYDFIGYLDDVYNVAYVEQHYGLNKLGKSENINQIQKSCNNVCIAVGSEGNLQARVKLFKKFLQAGFNFPSLIHHSSILFGNQRIGPGTIIEENVSIGPLTEIGSNCRIGPNTFIGHDVTIGDNVFTGPGVIVNGSAQINENTFLGSGAIVIQKIEVGANCIIGAGAVATGNIPINSIAVGVPARLAKKNVFG